VQWERKAPLARGCESRALVRGTTLFRQAASGGGLIPVPPWMLGISPLDARLRRNVQLPNAQHAAAFLMFTCSHK
jgi:hypothetical protein